MIQGKWRLFLNGAEQFGLGFALIVGFAVTLGALLIAGWIAIFRR